MPSVIHDSSELTAAILDVLSRPPGTKMTARSIGTAIDARYTPGMPYEVNITEFAGQNATKEIERCLVILVSKGEVRQEEREASGEMDGGDWFYVDRDGKGP
ncbi:MAG: hypothetical protein L3K16_04955 [Thermoplasmata archaeon]|nr:hypothetical protein [Thermoplasmata archaeon]